MELGVLPAGFCRVPGVETKLLEREPGILHYRDIDHSRMTLGEGLDAPLKDQETPALEAAGAIQVGAKK